MSYCQIAFRVEYTKVGVRGGAADAEGKRGTERVVEVLRWNKFREDAAVVVRRENHVN